MQSLRTYLITELCDLLDARNNSSRGVADFAKRAAIPAHLDSRQGKGLLQAAVRNDRPAALRQLLDMGLDPDERTQIGQHEDQTFSAGGRLLEAVNTGRIDLARGPVAPPQLSRLAAVYDAAVSGANPADVGGGRTTTRVWDFVNRAPDFDGLYVYQPILDACCRVIGAPFHLSTMHAREVNPGAPAQDLHADYRRTTDGWPMVGFIFMVDEFRRDNGATRFVPGSHRWPHAPSDVMQDAAAHYEGQVSACGPAGSVVIYNGSVWHGHGVNQTNEPRRSIQGAYIRRDDKQGTNQAARIRPEALARIGALAKYLLNVESQLPLPDARA